MLHIAPPSRDADRYAQQMHKNDILLYQWYIKVFTIEVTLNKENKIIVDVAYFQCNNIIYVKLFIFNALSISLK
jgi:hypothetical protein